MIKKWIFATAMVASLTGASLAQDAPPFGTPDDVDFANRLWQQLATARMVGPDALAATTYQGGTAPHTETLITLQAKVTVAGSEGFAIVKKNFIGADGAAATEEQVFADPQKYLRVNTIMFQRQVGYDPDNQDCFWVVYNPKGEVVVNPLGLNMAGKYRLQGDGHGGCALQLHRLSRTCAWRRLCLPERSDTRALAGC